jgi:hypothetical protein
VDVHQRRMLVEAQGCQHACTVCIALRQQCEVCTDATSAAMSVPGLACMGSCDFTVSSGCVLLA